MTNERATVAVIPAAGMGTRMRPATRAVPKAFLPVVDRPMVQYVVEEAARAGAVEVCLVVDPDVPDLVDRHFAQPPLPGLEEVQVVTVVQESPLGLGHAVLMAESVVGDRPFTCLLVDNLVASRADDQLPKMSEVANGHSVLCLREVEPDRLDHLGVIAPGDWVGDGVLEVRGALEKPGADQSPSRLAIMGRYLFRSELFAILRDLPPGHGDEIQLTDAIDRLGQTGRCRGVVTEADLLDVGTPGGLLHASTVLGLASPEYGPPYHHFLESIVGPPD